MCTSEQIHGYAFTFPLKLELWERTFTLSLSLSSQRTRYRICILLAPTADSTKGTQLCLIKGKLNFTKVLDETDATVHLDEDANRTSLS